MRSLAAFACALLALVLLGTAARAATPVQLPPGEPVEPWRAPLALAGLTPGSGRPGVEILVSGDRWVIIAWDASGVARAAELSRPNSASAREDLAWLAASLLRGGAAPKVAQPLPMPAPVPLPTTPAPPPPAPAAAPPKPKALAEEPTTAEAPPPPPPPSPAPAPAVPEPSPALSPALTPALSPALSPPPALDEPHVSIGAAALGGLRPGQAATGGLSVVLDARQAPFWADLRLYGVFSSGLIPVEGDDALGLWGLSGSAGWAPRSGPIEPAFGAGISLNRVRFQQPGWVAQLAWDPALHLDGGVGLPIGGNLRLTLGARVGVDLRKITFDDPYGDDPSLGRLWVWPMVGVILPLE